MSHETFQNSFISYAVKKWGVTFILADIEYIYSIFHMNFISFISL